jgi:hypothetical protein
LYGGAAAGRAVPVHGIRKDGNVLVKTGTRADEHRFGRYRITKNGKISRGLSGIFPHIRQPASTKANFSSSVSPESLNQDLEVCLYTAILFPECGTSAAEGNRLDAPDRPVCHGVPGDRR